MSKYDKNLPGETLREFRRLTNRVNLRFRVTLGDMALEDAFDVGVGLIDPSQSLGQFLDCLFRDGSSWNPLNSDILINPDIPEIREELAGIFGHARAGRSFLKFYLNHGSQISLDNLVGDLCRSVVGDYDKEPILLDLVIEQYFSPIAYSIGQGYWKSKAELVRHLDLQVCLVLSTEPKMKILIEKQLEGRLELLYKSLRDEGIVVDEFGLTESGSGMLRNLQIRGISLARKYDVFADVVLEEETGIIELGSGRGDDLRVHVYEEEGLDPVSTGFEVVELSNFEEWIEDWITADGSEEFFDRLLGWTVEDQPLDENILDRVIEAGLTYMEEHLDMKEGAMKFRGALRSLKNN